jgi:hypothetical protein
MISCWTLNVTTMVNLAPSLIVKGLSFSVASLPGVERSMVMGERPGDSSERDLMMQVRGSLASERSLPPPRPRDSL